MKCRQRGCRRNAEIYNLGNDRWECVLHHQAIQTREASRQARIDVRARREQRQPSESAALAQALEALNDIGWE